MTKDTAIYWNLSSADNQTLSAAVEEAEGLTEEFTPSMDEETGEYTRLARLPPGVRSYGWIDELYRAASGKEEGRREQAKATTAARAHPCYRT